MGDNELPENVLLIHEELANRGGALGSERPDFLPEARSLMGRRRDSEAGPGGEGSGGGDTGDSATRVGSASPAHRLAAFPLKMLRRNPSCSGESPCCVLSKADKFFKSDC